MQTISNNFKQYIIARVCFSVRFNRLELVLASKKRMQIQSPRSCVLQTAAPKQYIQNGGSSCSGPYRLEIMFYLCTVSLLASACIELFGTNIAHEAAQHVRCRLMRGVTWRPCSCESVSSYNGILRCGVGKDSKGSQHFTGHDKFFN